jgi:hypothetical protein
MTVTEQQPSQQPSNEPLRLPQPAPLPLANRIDLNVHRLKEHFSTFFPSTASTLSSIATSKQSPATSGTTADLRTAEGENVVEEVKQIGSFFRQAQTALAEYARLLKALAVTEQQLAMIFQEHGFRQSTYLTASFINYS